MSTDGNYPPDKWKPIKGYNSYMVSSNGTVINKYNKPLIQKPNKKGYMRVWLYNDGGRKQFFVHRLVADAFIPNLNSLPMVNHKDEDCRNNNVDNLEWCDDRYNKRYSQAIKVNQYDICGNFIKSWDVISDIESELNIPTTNISKCCKGSIKTINGFIFLYKDGNIAERLASLSTRKHKSKTEGGVYEL